MNFVSATKEKRKLTLPVRGTVLDLPIYFPSVSSLKTNGIDPYGYYKILQALGQTHFLISAYDIAHCNERSKFIKELQSNPRQNGPIILLDSGNYESYWLRDKAWKKDDFNGILENEICDLAFCYDKQQDKLTIEQNARWIKNSMLTSQKKTKKASILPILHSRKEKLIDNVLSLYDQNPFLILAIPERELGNGILDRLQTLIALRKELNKLDEYIIIHLLGTGNPLSLMLFSFCGADSFDGLEWCQTVVNSESALLYHFQQREMVEDDCSFCKSEHEIGDAIITTLGHNLNFYRDWMKKIRQAIQENKEEEQLKRYFNLTFAGKVIKMLA